RGAWTGGNNELDGSRGPCPLSGVRCWEDQHVTKQRAPKDFHAASALRRAVFAHEECIVVDQRCKRTGHPVSDFFSGVIPLDTRLGQSNRRQTLVRMSALTVAQRLQVICMVRN